MANQGSKSGGSRGGSMGGSSGRGGSSGMARGGSVGMGSTRGGGGGGRAGSAGGRGGQGSSAGHGGGGRGSNAPSGRAWKLERASVTRGGKTRSNKYSKTGDSGRKPGTGDRQRAWVGGYTRADGTKVAGYYRNLGG